MAKRIAIIDAHNHLQDEGLLPYRTSMVRELEGVGIAHSVVNGTTEADWAAVALLAREHRWVIPSYGLHPWFLKSRTPEWRESLQAVVAQGPCGIGEIGLDRWMKDFDIDDQKEVFLWQLALASERNLPATIHCLKAWGALDELLHEHAVPQCGFLLHAYSGPVEMVEGFVRRGAYFSFSGSFMALRKAERREVFREIPADRLLVETDAPAMALPPERTRFVLPNPAEGEVLNHPANIVAAYEGLAEIRGWSVETLAAQVDENFARLFGGVTS